MSEQSSTVNNVEVGLDAGTPGRFVAALARVPGVTVRTGAAAPYIRHGSERQLLRLLPRPLAQGSPEAAADEILAGLAPNDSEEVVPLVFASSLPRSLRLAFEQRGISYVDGRGDAHLVGPGLFIHIDTNPVSRSVRADAAAAGLGPVGIRAVQVIAAAPERAWSVAEVAKEAHVSAGQAHKVLRTLESAGLVVAEGTGPTKRRRLRDPGALLDWLADQARARRVTARLACSLYARNPKDLAVRASRSLEDAQLTHALTGALAASILGAGPTAVPRTILRIDPEVPLERAAQALGADVTDRGANLLLWSDTGRVGTHAREQHGNVWLAPPVRIYLDLIGERRGEDAAAHFRELVLKA